MQWIKHELQSVPRTVMQLGEFVLGINVIPYFHPPAYAIILKIIILLIIFIKLVKNSISYVYTLYIFSTYNIVINIMLRFN